MTDGRTTKAETEARKGSPAEANQPVDLTDQQLERALGGVAGVRQEQLNNKYPENMKSESGKSEADEIASES